MLSISMLYVLSIDSIVSCVATLASPSSGAEAPMEVPGPPSPVASPSLNEDSNDAKVRTDWDNKLPSQISSNFRLSDFKTAKLVSSR